MGKDHCHLKYWFKWAWFCKIMIDARDFVTGYSPGTVDFPQSFWFVWIRKINDMKIRLYGISDICPTASQMCNRESGFIRLHHRYLKQLQKSVFTYETSGWKGMTISILIPISNKIWNWWICKPQSVWRTLRSLGIVEVQFYQTGEYREGQRIGSCCWNSKPIWIPLVGFLLNYKHWL